MNRLEINVLNATAQNIATNLTVYYHAHLAAFNGVTATAEVIFSASAILLFVSDLFFALYPRVMPSSLGTQFDLTITNASSTPYTLKVMTVVAVVMTPLVVIYQGWTYWVFRKRVSASQIAFPERGILDVESHILHR